MDGGLKNNQKDLAQQFAKQHYMPNFKALYGKESEEFKTFKVEAEFEPLNLEVFDDAVEAVVKLNEQFPLTAESAGELLGIENFEAKIDLQFQDLTPTNKDSSSRMTKEKRLK